MSGLLAAISTLLAEHLVSIDLIRQEAAKVLLGQEDLILQRNANRTDTFRSAVEATAAALRGQRLLHIL